MVTAVKYILCRELVKDRARTDASGILMLQRWEPWCLLWLLLLLLTTIKTGVKSGFKYCDKTVSAHFTCSKHASFYRCLIFLCWFSSLYNSHVSDIFLLGIFTSLIFCESQEKGIANNDFRERINKIHCHGGGFCYCLKYHWSTVKAARADCELALLPLVNISILFMVPSCLVHSVSSYGENL